MGHVNLGHAGLPIGLEEPLFKLLAIWLLGGTIVVIQFASEKVQPVFQLENFVVHEITGTCFDQQDLLVGQVLGEPARNDASCGSTAYNQIVEDISISSCELYSGSHHVSFLRTENNGTNISGLLEG